MKFVMDRNIRAAAETFDRLGEVVRLDGRQIERRHLEDADALIVRSVTRVDEALLQGTPIRFVGTTTIGTDHLDTAWLDSQGIAWSSAPGCNADAAAQYTLAITWLACKRLGKDIHSSRVGIVGCGNVGSRVQQLFDALGADTVANDPPLEVAGRTGLVDLATILDCDIVCLHTPLTRAGRWPTYRMIGERELMALPDGALLVNAGRGDVIAGEALLRQLQTGRINAGLDVWPGEPRIAPELLAAVTVATPHVAGYSDDGKRNGTLMIHDAWCRWSGMEPAKPLQEEGNSPELSLEPGGETIGQALEAACFVEQHDAAMRALSTLSTSDRATAFDRLRRDYPPRRDFQAWTVYCPEPETASQLARLGFASELTK